jgi:hypothetical protein
MFDNWINSDLIYINDILNENGEISQNLILDKLKYQFPIVHFSTNKSTYP